MAEQLLSIRETAIRLGISRASFYNKLAELRAKGLQMVRVGRRTNIRESSLNRIITKAAETETAIC